MATTSEERKTDSGHQPDEVKSLRGFKPPFETRLLPYSEELELRVADGANGPVLSGYAAVFNKWSEDLGGFREMIKPGAFKKTIAEADIRACINHDPNLILGRNKAGTLTLSENNLGLKYEVPLSEQSYARDLVINVGKGNISGELLCLSVHFRSVGDPG